MADFFKIKEYQLDHIILFLDMDEDYLNEIDSNGNWPLMLAVKLSYKDEVYNEISSLLLNKTKKIKMKDLNGWSILDEAVN